MNRLVRTVMLTLAASITGGLILVPMSATAAPAAHSGVNDFSFTSYSVDYYLARDATGHSTMTTVETFVAKFPNFDQNRGLVRDIPNSYNGVPLNTDVVAVQDADGKAVHYTESDSASDIHLELGTDAFVHGTQTYVIAYTQQNVVREFSDTNDDELYWDTNGNGYDQPFGTVTAHVYVDPSVTQFLTGHSACYRGAQGSTDTCAITQAEGTKTDPIRSQDDVATVAPTDGTGTPATGQVFTATTSDLGAQEGMTVAITFAKGTFVQVPAAPGSVPKPTPLWVLIASWILIALSGVVLVLAIVFRIVLGGHDSRGRGIIIPQYSVPKDLNLLEASTLLGRGDGLSAQFVSFAVRGNIHIIDQPEGNEYTLQFVNADGVDPMELQLLHTLFGPNPQPGTMRLLGLADATFARQLSTVTAMAPQSILARGLRVKASSRASMMLAIVQGLLFFGTIGFTVISGFVGEVSPLTILGIVVAFVVLIVAVVTAIRAPVLTDAGAEQRDYLLGLRDYLQLAEADRFRMLQSPEGAERINTGNKEEVVKLYEKLLPFAVLWGVEKEWSNELAVYYEQGVSSPGWYVSNGSFNAAIFAISMSNFMNSASISATPPSTSSSGFGGGSFGGGGFGGGFSGGGGGGGGGGGR